MFAIAAKVMGISTTEPWGNRLFWLVFAALGVAFALPLLVSTALPSQDLPNHIAIGEALAHRGTDWSQQFESRLGLRPYHLMYIFLWAGGKVIGVSATMRLLLCACAIATPAALLYLGGAIGRNFRWASLFGFLFVFGDAYLVGFAPFLLCLPLILAGAGVAVRMVRGSEPSLRRVGVLAVIGLATVLMHPYGFVVLAIFTAVLCLAYVERPVRLAHVAAALAPALVVMAIVASAQSDLRNSSHLPIGFKLDYLARTPVFLLDAMRDHKPLYAAALLGLALVVWAVHRLARSRPRPRLRPTRRSPLWLVVALAVLYLWLPFQAGMTVWLDLRLAPFVWLAFILLVGEHLVADLVGRALVVLLCLVSAGGSLLLHQRFDAEIAPLYAVIDEMQPNARVLPVTRDGSSEVLEPIYARDGVVRYYSPYAHFASYYHMAKGGRGPFMVFHASLRWIPLVIRDDVYSRFAIAGPFMPRWTLSALPGLAPHFDYLLARGLTRQETAAVARLFEPVTEKGPFALFERPGALKTSARDRPRE